MTTKYLVQLFQSILKGMDDDGTDNYVIIQKLNKMWEDDEITDSEFAHLVNYTIRN